MEELRKLLEEQIDETLVQLIVSGARKKEGPSKVKVRPVRLKEGVRYQASVQEGPQVFHSNYEKAELVEQLLLWMTDTFKQLQLDTAHCTATALVSKKGKVTLKQKKQTACVKPQNLDHNRKKKYVLEEGHPVEFLVDLGVMTETGKIVQAKYDKFKQMNRFLEFIEDILPRLPKDREITILDFGCGKSYLTFAMYHYLKTLKGYDVRILGLDLKKDVIARCNELKDKYGYEKLSFYVGDIADYNDVDQVDMVVTLHACDTATDYALAKAVKWGARVILSVPCCQHELNGQMEAEVLKPVLQYGLLKERMAALVTDGLRAALLEQHGYETQVLEFIDMEHTPKNILIRAVKKEKTEPAAMEDYEACRKFFGVEPALYRLLSDKEEVF